MRLQHTFQSTKSYLVMHFFQSHERPYACASVQGALLQCCIPWTYSGLHSHNWGADFVLLDLKNILQNSLGNIKGNLALKMYTACCTNACILAVKAQFVFFHLVHDVLCLDTFYLWKTAS